MFSFEGDFRRKPVQSLRGASKQEEKSALLQRTQTERQNREAQRRRVECTLKIQAFYRGCKARQKLYALQCQLFDQAMAIRQKATKIPLPDLVHLMSKIIFFHRGSQDDQRLTWLCQFVLKQKADFLVWLKAHPKQGLYLTCSILKLCMSHLVRISQSNDPIAISLRMLEVFTSQDIINSVPENDLPMKIHSHLVQNGYFECMRSLLNARVPGSLERSAVAPTPLADSLFELIMRPVSYAAALSNKDFSKLVLCSLCHALLCPTYTEQVGQFLLPAMAYGKYPFPFVELLQALLSESSETNLSGNITKGDNRNKQTRQNPDSASSSLWTPWLLFALLMFSERIIGDLKMSDVRLYIHVLKHLVCLLPWPHDSYSDNGDSESEDEADTVTMDTEGYPSLLELRSECLRLLDAPSHVQCLVNCVNKFPTPDTFASVCAICHAMMADQKFYVHRTRLLYRLAFNTSFIRHLWESCLSVSSCSAAGSESSLLHLLSTGLPILSTDLSRIVPLVSVFCSLFTHSLLTIHDAEFHLEAGSAMPFSLSELVSMCQSLRDACLGIIELAHPDAKPIMNDDYRVALQRVGIRSCSVGHSAEERKATQTWAYLFKVIARLVQQLYERDTRRSFCPYGHWLARHINIAVERASSIYRGQHSMFIKRASQKNYTEDDDGPPLSSKELRTLVILTEIPFVVTFQDRVKVLQHLLTKDRSQEQSEMGQFIGGPGINVTIRRNFIYEDAFEKFSTLNEPNIRLKTRVQLVNVVGLDEAGIDGGGIFREFLTELLKTGFDPNRGFFKYTNDRMLYPNPQAQVLMENFTEHFFFLGRMLGKALYENMLIELPFASFFISKILSHHSGQLDIHHLASLDPEMYRNLLFVKNFDGDMADLGLDFSIVRSDFGDTQIVDLKPGGRNIAVTNQNCIEYIHLMADYLLNRQMRIHCNAFRQGLADVIDLDWLRMFDHRELQVLISGASVPIDVMDLRRHTNYSGGYTEDHQVIINFWRIVETFTEQQRRQLLKFVTSCSRPPLLGFKDLYPAFCIHHAGHETDRLPTASTCMNLLKLPEFHNEATMREKLIYAVESGAGFELS